MAFHYITMFIAYICSFMNVHKFNINEDFLAYSNVTVKDLKPYLNLLHKTEESIFVLCGKGSARMAINHTKYRIDANGLLAIPPETFIQLTGVSDDVELHFVIFPGTLFGMTT